MLKVYAIYDEYMNVVETIKSNRKPTSRAMINTLGETRPEVLEIVDEPVMEIVPSLDGNGDPILNENGDPVLISVQQMTQELIVDGNGNLILDENGDPTTQDVEVTYKKLQINSTALAAADTAKAASDLTAKWDQLRAARNALLAESDAMWIEAYSKDLPVIDINTYKQALRDWPANEVDIDNPTPPTKP